MLYPEEAKTTIKKEAEMFLLWKSAPSKAMPSLRKECNKRSGGKNPLVIFAALENFGSVRIAEQGTQL